jgi:hypothetical protein
LGKKGGLPPFHPFVLPSFYLDTIDVRIYTPRILDKCKGGEKEEGVEIR